MKLNDVLRKVAGSTSVAHPDVKKVVDATFAEIKSVVEGGDKVVIPGVGVFQMKERLAGEKTDKEGNVRKVEAAMLLSFRPILKRAAVAAKRKKRKAVETAAK